MNNDLKLNKYNKCNFEYKLNDARVSVPDLNMQYDVVFLDAFSSKKCPELWTIDFLSVIKQKMKSNSLLLSYSKSTPFRSALLNLGFYVGKTIIDNNDMGTVASLNSCFIKNHLSDYDYKIISSKSGLPYRDKNLNLPAESIIENRNNEIKNSTRISRSQVDKYCFN